MTTPDHPVLILATVPDDDIAYAIASHLLMSELIANVNYWSGVTTMHKWGQEMHTETEVAMILYTRASLAERAVAEAVSKLASPSGSFVVVDTTGGHPVFLQWIMGRTAHAN